MTPAIDDYEKSFAPPPKPLKRIPVKWGEDGIQVGWAEKLSTGEVAIVFFEGEEATPFSEKVRKEVVGPLEGLSIGGAGTEGG